MSTVFAERPHYFEGQYLGAADLEALATYLRELHARHALGAHTCGIVAGIDLVGIASPNGDTQYFLTPGVAVDGYGRTIVVAEPYSLSAALFTSLGSGLVPLWIRYDEQPGGGVRRGFGVCDATDAYQRVSEAFVVEVGARATVSSRESGVSVGDRAFADAREALGWYLEQQPLAPDATVAPQLLPVEGDPSLWLIPVGCVPWQQGAPGQLLAPTEASRKQSRVLRRQAGVVAESVIAGDGLLRLRTRWLPRSATLSVEEVCNAVRPTEKDLIVCDDHLEFREPIWIEAHTRFLGDARLYGRRLEFQAAAGTDYVGGAPVTALRRVDAAATELQVLLGKSADPNSPTRLVIGVSAATNTNKPCELDFDFAPRVVVQEDGKVGIGTATAPVPALAQPLTIRADAQGGALALQTSAGAASWQMRLAANNAGLAFRHGNPATSQVYLGNGGGVGIGTEAPGGLLDVRGEIRHGASGELTALGGEQALRALAGRVGSIGNVIAGAGYTVARTGTGTYRVTFTRPFAQAPVVTATIVDSSSRAINILSPAADHVDITTTLISSPGTTVDNGFTFIAIGVP